MLPIDISHTLDFCIAGSKLQGIEESASKKGTNIGDILFSCVVSLFQFKLEHLAGSKTLHLPPAGPNIFA
jgi:hypothetical protein